LIVNYRKCRRCNAHYLEADFLAHRQAGYCTLECSIGEPCGISTAESMAWKDKISIPSQRERYKPESMSNIPLRTWKFDMVHYPPPIGWQIENWRLETKFGNDETHQEHKRQNPICA